VVCVLQQLVEVRGVPGVINGVNIWAEKSIDEVAA
jgi:hypothetical protein